MNKWRFIESGPANGSVNMALDESIFTIQARGKSFIPTLRVYTWDKPCVTIGYFQKHADFNKPGHPVIRRLTGGLSVLHGGDISYALVSNDENWQYVYDQENTYKEVHAFIKEALSASGIDSEFVRPEEETPKNAANNICVKTFYQHDLHNADRKIVGSCQRRRGKNLLVQGSIHMPHRIDFTEFCNNLRASFQKFHSAIEPGKPSEQENICAKTLSAGKYSTPAWNEKF